MLLAYAGSLMSKSMLVTMPVVLLLVDLWPLDRLRTTSWKRLILEKVPIGLMALVIAVITVRIQPYSVVHSTALPLPLRLENAALSYSLYLRDFFYFAGLSVFYPFPKSIPPGEFIPALLVVLLITVGAFFAARRTPVGRPLLAGWLWFLITLLPVIGILQSGTQARADRFTYFPAIGLIAGIVFLWPAAWNDGKTAFFGKLAAVCAVLTLTVYMVLQLSLWRDPLTLYLDGIAHAGDSGILEFSLGKELEDARQSDKALECYIRAYQLEPALVEARNNAARLMLDRGLLDDAILQLKIAGALRPGDPPIQMNWRRAQDMLQRAGSRPSETMP
jgi:hypothetical protein